MSENADSNIMPTRKRLARFSVALVVLPAALGGCAYTHAPAIPAIEAGAGWRLFARNDWYFSSPFAELVIEGRSYAPPDIDEALVFAKRGRPIFPEKLQAAQQRYELPPEQKRFFRLRFAVPQSKFGSGFAIRITALQRDGEAVRVPGVKFNWASSPAARSTSPQ